MKKLTKQKIINIFGISVKLSFTAVIAALLYIAARLLDGVSDLADLSFVCHVPEMLEHMLLSVTVITAFMALMTYIIRKDENREQ